MKTLNNSEGQDFNSWSPKSIVGALSIQLQLILPIIYTVSVICTWDVKCIKTLFKILHFSSFSGWLQSILKQMIKPMQMYWSRSMITGLNRYVEHL
jgi:hypothetical protein